MELSRVEHILKYFLGEEATLPQPLSRVEELLIALGELIEEGKVTNPISIRGRVDTVGDLPSDAEPGWLYFVGLETDTEFTEYIYLDSGRWEYLGSSMIAIDTTLSTTSTNPVQNSTITTELNKKPGEITTGKQYTIDGQTVTAGPGAEAFNNLTSNKASGQDSHAEGYMATAFGDQSHAEGAGTTASGDRSHAEGGGTRASGTDAHAEGGSTLATGSASHAEGGSTTASGDLSHAEGEGTVALSACQHVQGKFNVEDANDTYAFIIGNGTDVNARHNAFSVSWDGSVSYGSGTTASGAQSHAEGTGATASGAQSHAEGSGTTASKANSHAEGQGTKAHEVNAHAEGAMTTASGAQSHAEGNSTTASGAQSHAEGGGTTASGAQSHAEGAGTTASKTNSHAEGQGTKASGDQSHAEGYGTTASGAQSHAEGQGTTASGANSHVEGVGTVALSAYQHVQGKFNVEDSNNTYAFIIGNGTSANDRRNAFAVRWDGSVSHGFDVQATGYASHAEGHVTSSNGAMSHAEGYGTIASSTFQHVQGKYNAEDANDTYAFIIGNGTADNARHNAFAVDWNGLIYVNGSATGVDISAFPSPSDINTAITKANAAAPQSTTYTKAEIDAMIGNINTVLEEVL